MNNNDAFLDRTNPAPTSYRYSQPEPVRWWIPLVAASGALLAFVLGTAVVVSGLVNSTIGGIS